MMLRVTTMPERRDGPGGPSRWKTVVVVAVVLLVGMWLHSREEARQVAEQTAPTSQPRAQTVPRRAEAPADRREAAGQPGGGGTGAREARGAGGARGSAAESGDERYDLEADEERGGHTLARHVGKSDDELRERLDRERGISAASTYSSRAVAERTVARTLHDQQDRLQSWTERRGNRPNLALDYHGRPGEVLGRSIRRGRDPVDCGDAVVVLRWAGRDYYVLTTYPECSR
jgi:hypothetical protein